MIRENYIKETLNTIKDVYLNDPNRIIEDYRTECGRQLEYSGREILELLQNAVDELTDKKKNIKIELNGNKLEICNNGNPFTEDGITSIIYSSLSPKYKKNNYIGNKGTGFKSVLNWANTIRIYSDNLAVEFSKQNSISILKSLLGDEYTAKNSKLKNFSPNLNEVAVLRLPKIIKKIKTDFDTVIELIINDEHIDSVKKQIESINAKTLLFLPKLETLEVSIDGKDYRVFQKVEEEIKGNKDLTKIIISEDDSGVEEWLVLKKEGTITVSNEEKRYLISVAYNKEEIDNSHSLYCFFKTSINCPVGFILNATLELDGSREHLINTEFNVKVLDILMQEVINFAEYVNENNVGYGIVNLLKTNGNFDEYFLRNEIDKRYYEEIIKREIFPNVNDKFVKLTKQTKFYGEEQWSQLLKGNDFDNLLMHSQKNGVNNFIKMLLKEYVDNSYCLYNYSDLTPLINKNIKTLNLNANQLAKLCKLYLDNFASALSQSYQTKPNILLDTNNQIIENKTAFTYPIQNEYIDLPSFANITYLSKSFIEELEYVFNVTKSADLATKMTNLNVSRYDPIEVIRVVFAELGKDSSSNNKDLIIKYKEAIVWLYEYNKTTKLDFSNEKFFYTKSNEKINIIKLITRNNKLESVSHLYMGEEYGETLVDSLFPKKDDIFVAGYKVYDVADEEKEEFRNFLISLGVENLPREKEEEVYPVPYAYKQMANYYEISTLNIKTIDNIEYILQNAKTQIIIEWLLVDTRKKSLIESKLTMVKYKYSYYKYDKNLLSWLYYKFNSTPWIECEGKRRKICECTTQKIGSTITDLLQEINIENYIINNTPDKEDEVLLFFKKVGLIDEFYKLDTERIYQILLKLAENNVDSKGRITKSIYNSIMKNNSIVETNLNEGGKYRENFKKSGHVFCKSGSFVENSQAKYLPQINPSKKLIQEELIDISTRLNANFIKKFLFVEPVKLEFLVENFDISNINGEFKEDFNQYKNVINIYRKDVAKVAEKNDVRRLNIILCNSVTISNSGNKIEIDKYSYVQDSNDKKIYISIEEGKSLEELKNDINFAEVISNIILDVLKINQSTNTTFLSTLRNLYQKSINGREENIRKDFPDEDLEEDEYAIEEKRKKILEDLLAKNNLDNLDISNIDFSYIGSNENSKYFVEVLKRLNITLKEFNNLTEFNISFAKYNEVQREKYIKENVTKYKDILLAHYEELNKPKKDFLSCYNDFWVFMMEGSNDIVDYDKCFKDKFVLLKNYCNKENLQSANEIYKANKSKFAQEKDVDMVNKFLNSKENDSLLYFDLDDDIATKYNAFLDSCNKEKEETEVKLREVENRVLAIEQIDVEKVIDNKVSKNLESNRSYEFGRNVSHDRNNEAWGGKAEELVYNAMLGDEEQYKNIKWVSENAKKAVGDKNNPDGKEGLGYDITYEDNNGETIFVEVKSTTGSNLEFDISYNELMTAINNKKRYKVIMVTNLEKNPEIKDLNFMFDLPEGMDVYNNQNYTIHADKFKIKCKQKYN